MVRLDRLLPPARPGKPWTLVLDDSTTLKVPERTVADQALYGGMELDEARLTALKDAAAAAAVRDRAAGLLTARLMSSGMLKEKLTAKGATPEQAEDAVQWAEDIGLLSDLTFARELVRAGQSRGWGLYKIKDSLYRRRVPQRYWAEALADMTASPEAIDAFLSARLKDPEDPRQLKRAADALARRGFSWEEVSEGIDRFRESWRDR